MIEDQCNAVIQSLLSQSIPGLNVVVGIADNFPELQTPVVCVSSEIEEVLSANPISFTKLKMTVELVTLSGQDTAAYVDSTLTAIDLALSTTPAPAIKANLPLTGLWMAWGPIPKSTNAPGERRSNTREISVTAYLQP